jgi:hypothetical protein
MDIPLKLLGTNAAAGYLTERGVRRKPATLRKERCFGTGPTFRVLNGRPFYIEPDLDAWIEERLSVPMRSNAERALIEASGVAVTPGGRGMELAADGVTAVDATASKTANVLGLRVRHRAAGPPDPDLPPAAA